MAVILSLTQPNGVITNYHRVSDIRFQPKGSLDVQVSSYLNQSSRNAGDQPVNSQYVILDETVIDPGNPIQAQIYAQLMASGGLLSGGTEL